MDDSIRALERAVVNEPGDDAAAVAYLAALVRAGDALPEVEPITIGSDSLLGPLLEREKLRLRSLDPSLVHEDVQRTGWVRATTEHGRALFGATLQVRLIQLEFLAQDPPSGLAVWAFHAVLDLAGDAALDRLTRVLVAGEPNAADRIARVLAARSESRVGNRLVALLLELPAESRPRLYKALAQGTVPLEATAREKLRVAIAREAPSIRKTAYHALRRVSGPEDLKRDLASGPPEIRSAAFETLMADATRSEAEELMRHGLADADAPVRLSALELLSTATWLKHPRVADWGMSRLLDKDRAVRQAALKLIRRIALPARQLPRLKLIVDEAPPGIRPVLERLLELQEKRAR